MSEFFEPPPPPPEPEEEEDYEPKPWHGPPSNVLGGYVPLNLTLARTGDVIILVRGLLAYENGLEFQLQMRARNWEVSESLGDVFHGYGGWRRGREQTPDNEIPPQQFRFGIQFPDGSKATNTNRAWWASDEEPTPPTLWERGGGGGGGEWSQGYWVWPLPPAGPLELVCEWPVAGIPLTRTEIDGSQIVEASRRAEVLWAPEPRGRPVYSSMGSWGSVGFASAEPAEPEEEDD